MQQSVFMQLIGGLVAALWSDLAMRAKGLISSMTLAFLVVSTLVTITYAKSNELPPSTNRTIQSASELDYPPFSIIREDGSADGFSVELLKNAAEAVQLKVNFKVGPWNEIKTALINDQLDALPLVSYSEERDNQMDFTAPYLRMHGSIFVRKGDETIKRETDLKGKTVIVMREDTAHEYVVQNDLTDKIILTDSYEKAFQMLSAGKYDAIVVQHLVGLQIVKKLQISNVRSVRPLYETSLKPTPEPLSGFEQKFCIAVKEGDKELQALLNEGLALIFASGKYDELYKKWFTPILPDPPISMQKKVEFVFSFIVPSLAVLLLVGVWLLKREVSRKTKDFKEQVAASERAQLALATSETQLKTLLNTLPDMIWLKDPDGIYLSCNKRFEFFFGARENEIIGKTDYDFVDQNLADFFRKHDQAAVDKGQPMKNEEEVVFANDGHHEILETIKTPMFDSNGRLIGILGIGRDITHRKQMEESLRATTQRFKGVLDNSPLLMSEIDLEGRYLMVNQATVDFYNLPSPELVGKSFDQLLPPDVVEVFMKRLAQVKESRGPIDVVDAIPYGDTEKHYSTILFPLFDKTGNIASIGAIANDITGRLTAEKELERSLSLLRTLAQLVPGVIYQYRLYPDGRSAFPYSSPGMYDVYEVTPEQVREDATMVFGRLHPGDHDRVSEAIMESARTLKTFYCEFRVVLPSQGLRWRWSKANPQRTEDGGTLWHGIIIDITDRKQAEEEQQKLKMQLQQAHKMEAVGRLAGGVAHDYNNMLSVILGYTELIRAKLPAADPLQDDLSEIFKAANRSADITRQLLAFARKQAIVPKVVDLNANIESMLKMLRRLIGENIGLSWQPAGSLWPVKIDPAQLDQMLANLCVNARDAIAGVGSVVIETGNVEIDDAYCTTHNGFLPGDFVRLIISDTGSGMDQETIQNIFEPFFTTKKMDEGTGLGLATVFGIVKQNQGFINVYSEVGKGTAFSIYLPRFIGDFQKEAVPKAGNFLTGNGETVLLVEDEPAIMRMAHMMLKRLGYKVLTANTPGQAISIAKQKAKNIDLLISDVVMPEMNGRELSHQIEAFCPNLKTLYMSGYTANVIAHHGIIDEGTNFIQKPFSMKEIGAKIKEVLHDEI